MSKLIEENDYEELKERMIECWVWGKLHYMIDTERFRNEALRKVMEKNKEKLKELCVYDHEIGIVAGIITSSKMDDENYLRKFRVEGDVLVSPDHCTIRIRDEENAKELIELLKTMHKEYVKILNENPDFQHACKLKEETRERAEEAEQRLRNFLQNKFGSSVFYQ